MEQTNRKRLDLACVERGLAPSRQQAQGLILAGQVLVDGQRQTKAGYLVASDVSLGLASEPPRYVSRGGIKLEAALEAFSISPKAQVAIDVGASTGGFTDCMLQRGARHVVAIDVGYGQLDWKLRQDIRVTCIERTNIRRVTESLIREQLPEPELWPLELATIDVSFISLKLALPPVAQILDPGVSIVALVKPQFEAGRSEVGRGGVIRDPDVRQQTIDGIASWAEENGFDVKGGVDSPIRGPKGNLEHFLHLVTR